MLPGVARLAPLAFLRRGYPSADRKRLQQRFLRQEPVTAGPPSGSYRLRKFAQRNRAALAATGAVALTAIALVAPIVLSAALLCFGQ